MDSEPLVISYPRTGNRSEREAGLGGRVVYPGVSQQANHALEQRQGGGPPWTASALYRTPYGGGETESGRAGSKLPRAL